jgi:hypothetical protein
MENRVKKKVTEYFNLFKDNILKNLNSLPDSDEKLQLMNYLCQYNRIELNEDDFSKRKRLKNHVPEYDRCCAKRADNDQCTRRKKDGDRFCGTHLKGRPHGEIMDNEMNKKYKVDLTILHRNGIPHYVDDKGNEYPAEYVLKCEKV